MFSLLRTVVFGTSQGSNLRLNRFPEIAPKVQLESAAELLVSDAIDERTEKTRKHRSKQKGAEEDLGAVIGPDA